MKKLILILVAVTVVVTTCSNFITAKSFKTTKLDYTPYQKGAWLVKSYEGLHMRPYVCPAGHPTIGWGHVIKPHEWKRLTGMDEKYFRKEWNMFYKHTKSRTKANELYAEKGSAVPLSPEGADMLFLLDFEKHVNRTIDAFPNLREYPEKLYAIASLAYNIKGGAQKLSSASIGKAIHKEDWSVVEKKILQYCRANGKVLPGLERRRREEAKLFKGEYDKTARETVLKKIAQSRK